MKKDTPGEKGWLHRGSSLGRRNKGDRAAGEHWTHRLQPSPRVKGKMVQVSTKEIHSKQVKSPKTFGAVYCLACFGTQLNS